MAKVTGPLMSLDASGAFGGTLVFGKWKGRPTVRQLVTPSNPNTAFQIISRNYFRISAAVQTFVNKTLLKGDGRLLTDKAIAIAAAPSGYAWNGNMVKVMIGPSGATALAHRTAYAAFSGPQKGAYDTAALALVPPFAPIPTKLADGSAGTPVSPGEQLYFLAYAMADLTGGTPPTAATPPVYA
jgi:hypothetical protein